MKFIQKNIWPLLIVFLLTLPTIKAFTIPEFYTSHDGQTHTARLANYYLAIKEGQLPPQLAPTLFGGFGFPIFVFIYPLPYLLGSIYHQLGLSYTDSAELVMASGQIISALLIYLFFKLETKNNISSIIASLFFTWAPYRFLMLYVRGAFAESFAYIFVATSLICLNRIFEDNNRQWIGLTALSLSGLLLSHQLVSVMFLPVLLWYFLSKLFFTKNKKTPILSAIASLILGFSIAAYIYFPAFFERKYLRFDSLISYTQDHFVTLKQLIRSPWSYGFSHKGTNQDDMSFQIGLTHLAAVAIASLTVIKSQSKKPIKDLLTQINFSLLWWLSAFGISVILMLEHPLIHQAWKTLPGLNYLDFPWRLLGVAVATSSFVVLYLLQKTKNNFFLIIFLLFFIFYSNRNHLRINQTVVYSDEHFENYPDTATWQNEFLPVTRITNKWKGIDTDFQVRRGQAEITSNINKTQHLDLTVKAAEKSEILIHRLYFPGWKIFINGQETPTTDEKVSITDASVDLQSGKDYSGFIKIDLEPGTHQTYSAKKSSSRSSTNIRNTRW